MRIALILDEDMAGFLRNQARLGQAVQAGGNDALQRGSPRYAGGAPAMHRVKPIHGGIASGVDPLKFKKSLNEDEGENLHRLSQ